MIVLASRNGRIGLPAAIEVMAQGGSAIDAVEAELRQVRKQLRQCCPVGRAVQRELTHRIAWV